MSVHRPTPAEVEDGDWGAADCPTRSRRWTEHEDTALRNWYANGVGPVSELAHVLGRGTRAVVNRAYRLRLAPMRVWTADEDIALAAWYSQGYEPDGLQALADSIGRSRIAVALRASRLKLSAERGRHARPPRKPRRKYDSDEERQAALAAYRSQQWKVKPHPRGMAGKKHSPETLAVLRERSRAMNARKTPEQKAAQARQSIATKLERYGTAGPVNVGNPYSRTRGGKRADLGGMFFRSAWEANYARYLNWLIEQGQLQAWEYEPVTFRFEGVSRGPYSYTPDFRLTEKDGRQHFHEIKGWMDGASKSRLRRMAKFYPDIQVSVIGSSEYRGIANWARMIPGWEDTGA